MSHSSRTFLTLTLSTLTGVAFAAAPILPDASVATNAVRTALQSAPASKPTAAPAPASAATAVPAAAAAFQQAVAPQASTATAVLAVANPTVKATVTTAKSTPVKAVAKTPAVKTTATKTTTTAKTTKTTTATAAQARQNAIARVQQSTAVRATGRTAVVRATAYNSLPNQTDATPFITATGTRTRFGVIALSRDLLRVFPYGTRVRIEDLSGQYNNLLRNQIFVVEDTMHPRKANTIDIWMSSRSQALQWGARNVRITAVR